MATPTRVSGMMSGIDTESVVKAYVQTYIDKKTKVQQSQTKLSYKQEAWKALNTKVYSLYNKAGSLRFTNSYNLKKTTVSDATKATVSASSNAVIGSQNLKIKQLAKTGYLTGAQLAKKTTESSTLSSLGYGEGETKISVRVGSGEEKEITLNGDTKISDVISQLKQAGVNANFDANNRRIFVSSKESGADNDFAITASSINGQKALSSLGLLTDASADIKGYAANAIYAKNTNGDDYYEYDEEGNIKYDANGVAITNGTYDARKTKESIAQILTDLANAYSGNVGLASEKALLNAKIEYTEALNTVNDVKGSDTGVGELFVDLVNKQNDGAQYVFEDEEGIVHTYKNMKSLEDGSKVYYNDSEDEADAKTIGAEETELDKLSDKVTELAKTLGLIETETDEESNETTTDDTKYKAFLTANTTYNKYLNDTSINNLDKYNLNEVEGGLEGAKSRITAIDEEIADNKATIANNSYWDKKDYSAYYGENGLDTSEGSEFSKLVDSITEKISYGSGIVDNTLSIDANSGAVRVSAQDAIIELNEATYTSSSSNFSINGLNINAIAVTGDEGITITTSQDNQGIYDKVKDFLSQYNELINEMQSLYNADSAKGYEPLTDDQKEEMSEKEIEKWEDKIKDAILRRDSSLGTLINKMTSAMSKPIQLNGKSYSLSSFGIQTLGYMNAAKNEQYAYHIYGDQDDSAVSGKEDQLMAMINSDPETVTDFMRELSAQLYDAVGSEMKSSNLRTAYTVYNDKQMAKDYTNYTKSIKEWENKIADMEDRYYKKFSAMESALAKMQSATSSLSSLLGN